MPKNPNETIICPNCGAEARGNFCYQCGQETHLHKETTWGLIMHFLGHYFHYDSKFWQTLKALVFSPGKLTLAYWNKQRARYIPPVSLYIFISAVYFLFSVIAFSKTEKKLLAAINDSKGKSATKKTYKINNNLSFTSSIKDTGLSNPLSRNSKVLKNFDKISKDPDKIFEILEPMMHNMPKIFFFMIPFMAMMLKLLFFRHKELYFVDHVIFSLHFHSFYFLGQLLITLFEFLPLSYITVIASFVSFIIYITNAVYYISAMKNVYKVSTGQAILFGFTVGFAYASVWAIIMASYGYYMLSTL